MKKVKVESKPAKPAVEVTSVPPEPAVTAAAAPVPENAGPGPRSGARRSSERSRGTRKRKASSSE